MLFRSALWEGFQAKPCFVLVPATPVGAVPLLGEVTMVSLFLLEVLLCGNLAAVPLSTAVLPSIWLLGFFRWC